MNFYAGGRIVAAVALEHGRTPTQEIDYRHQKIPYGDWISYEPALLVVLCGLFIVMAGVAPWRRLRNLDVAAALSLVVSVVLFQHRYIELSLLAALPGMVYLLLRCAGRAFAPARDPVPSRPLLAALTPGLDAGRRVRWLRALLVVLALVYVMVGVSSFAPVDVIYAVMEGATTLIHGVLPYGHMPPGVIHGDTYPILTYLLYTPLALVAPVTTVWDSVDGGLSVAVLAALVAALGVFRIVAGGRRRAGVRRPAEVEEAGLRAAVAWLAFPPLLITASTGTTDVALAAMLVFAVLLWRRPAACSAMLAVAGWFKLAPFALLPVCVAPLRGRRLAACGGRGGRRVAADAGRPDRARRVARPGRHDPRGLLPVLACVAAVLLGRARARQPPAVRGGVRTRPGRGRRGEAAARARAGGRPRADGGADGLDPDRPAGLRELLGVPVPGLGHPAGGSLAACGRRSRGGGGPVEGSDALRARACAGRRRMSATTPAVSFRRATSSGRFGRAVSVGTVPLRAFLVSRAIVIAAGVAGALAVPRRIGWERFDPLHLSERLGAVGNVLAAPSVRWDSIHYLTIAGHGYAAAGNTPFFPLYPVLIRVLGYPLGSDALAGIVISAVSFMVALALVHRLTELELGRRAADATVLLVALSPLSFFFSAVYTESLFLALSVGSLYAARRGRWALASGLGALAAVTRVTGVLLVIPLATMFFAERRRPDRRLGWILLVPAALGCYLGYLAASGFGLLSPFARGGRAVAPSIVMTGSISTVVSAMHAAAAGLRSLGAGPIYQPSIGGPFPAGTESLLLLGVLVIAVVALVAAFRRLPLAYGAYALAALVVCTWSPVTGQPLKSFDRYTLTIFPLWMAAGGWLSERRLTRPLLLVGGALLAFWTFQFATWSWVA